MRKSFKSKYKPLVAAIAALSAAHISFAEDTVKSDVAVTGAQSDILPREVRAAGIQEAVVLSEVKVTGAKIPALSQPSPQPWAASQVSREGIAILGGAAQANPNRLFDLMPSVHTESFDVYGLSPRGGRNLSIRGKGDFHFTRNVEGLPLTGLVGNNELFDLENVAKVELYRSAMPAYAGLGVSNTTGAMDMTLLRPEEKSGAYIRQGFGSYNFNRTFARLDSGQLGSGTSFFASASHMTADKWKGAGESPANRVNFTGGISQTFSNGARVELFAVNNHIGGNDYRPMNYAQMQNKSNWRNFDFNNALVPGSLQLWYDYNRNDFEDTAVLAKISLPVGDKGLFSFRPYWGDNRGFFLFNPNASTALVRRWDVEHQQKGFIAQYDLKISPALDVSAGYWWMDMESPPPPVYQKDYTPQANGGLVFSKWNLLSKHGDHRFNNPFVQISHRTKATTISGGLRMAQQKQPNFSYYSTAGLPDVSYEQVWSYNPTLDPWQQVVAKTTREWLPNLSVRHELNPHLALTGAYSRRIGRADWGPVASSYNSNRAAFVAQGISLQQVFSNLKPEISDNIDLGFRYVSERWAIAPNFYYARTHDKEVSLYDPRVNVSYFQSVASAVGIGAELEGSYHHTDNLSSIFALSYNKYSFDQNIQAKSGAVTLTDGKQVPNSARTLAKLGLDWRFGNWNAAPIMRYVGKRYGDILNQQKVNGYFLADFHLTYHWRNISRLQNLDVNLSVLNLFDKSYIGQISATDLDLNANATYFAGAPRTVAMTVSAKF